MMDIAKSETFRNFTTSNMALLFFIKLKRTALQSLPKFQKWLCDCFLYLVVENVRVSLNHKVVSFSQCHEF